MKAIKICADGSLHVINISPTFDKIREIVGGAVDNIRLFSDVMTYIKRYPLETDKYNRSVHGVKGDVLITGGRGSYIMDLTEQQINDIKALFNGGGS